jgi:hypothetical protein
MEMAKTLYQTKSSDPKLPDRASRSVRVLTGKRGVKVYLVNKERLNEKTSRPLKGKRKS